MPRRDLSISMHERRCTYWNAGAMKMNFIFLFSCSKYIHWEQLSKEIYIHVFIEIIFSKLSEIFKYKFCFSNKPFTVLKITLSFINKYTSYSTETVQYLKCQNFVVFLSDIYVLKSCINFYIHMHVHKNIKMHNKPIYSMKMVYEFERECIDQNIFFNFQHNSLF